MHTMGGTRKRRKERAAGMVPLSLFSRFRLRRTCRRVGERSALPREGGARCVAGAQLCRRGDEFALEARGIENRPATRNGGASRPVEIKICMTASDKGSRSDSAPALECREQTAAWLDGMPYNNGATKNSRQIQSTGEAVMKRREFLASSPAVSAAAGGAETQSREFYELRYYQLHRGPGVQMTQDYLRDAAIPALNRAGIKPVGVFETLVGPQSPSLYVLIPHPSAESVLTAWEQARADKEYQERGAAFLNAPSSNPAFVRVESQLMAAFATHPRITPPPAGPRAFELRTYDSATEKANLTKIEMFNTGEIDIFKKAGFHPVFFGEKLIGPRWPNLTYMLASASLEDRNRHWAAFGADPEWNKLKSTPGYSDAEIVSNITNVLLRPAEFSQV